MARSRVPDGFNGDWLDAAQKSAKLAPALSTCGIFTQVDYLTGRLSLSDSIRRHIDTFRLRYLLEHTAPGENDLLIEAFAPTPDEFRCIPASTLHVGVRSTNCLQRAGLQTIGEIVDVGTAGLSKLTNCGETTIVEIRDAIRMSAVQWLERSQVLESAIDDVSAAPTTVGPVTRRTSESLDNFRLRHCLDHTAPGERNVPIEAFASAPDKFRCIPASTLNLGVRATNCIQHARLQTIGAIADLGTTGLLDLPNCGKTTVAEIRDAMRMSAVQWLERSQGFESGVNDLTAAPAAVSPPSPRASESLEQGLRASLGSLSPKVRSIVERRLGLVGSVETLEQIGKDSLVTRERIRQIESRAYKAIRSRAPWARQLGKVLQRVLEIRLEPAWLILAPTFDPFFEGFDYGEVALARVIEVFGDGYAHCFRVAGALIMASIKAEKFEQMRQAFQEEVRALLEKRPTQFQIEILAESMCINAGARELHRELYLSFQPLYRFAQPPDSSDLVLVAYGRGTEQMVREILEESAVPLHYSEIHQRLVSKGREDLEIRRVHSSLGQPGVFLFGRGTYGLRRHMNATDDEVKEMKEIAEEVMLAGDPDRQWHAQEILEAMPPEFQLVGGDLTAYQLYIALSDSTRVRSLNRMVWVVESSEYRHSGDRIDVAQACAALLREAGRPLTRSEIRHQLKDWRGTGRHFQIHNSEEIISLSPGLWGLRERDLPLNHQEIAESLACLQRRLAEDGVSIHLSEMKGKLREGGLKFAEAINEYWIFSLVGTDSRFRVFHGGYVGLSTWEKSRRFTAQSAARELSQAGIEPRPISEFIELLKGLIGRPIGRADAASALREAGFEFNHETDTWQMTPEDDDQGM
jgi:Bacterial RNA polymerase, alpha chain C terminal domain/Sigma-70, region 4